MTQPPDSFSAIHSLQHTSEKIESFWSLSRNVTSPVSNMDALEKAAKHGIFPPSAFRELRFYSAYVYCMWVGIISLDCVFFKYSNALPCCLFCSCVWTLSFSIFSICGCLFCTNLFSSSFSSICPIVQIGNRCSSSSRFSIEGNENTLFELKGLMLDWFDLRLSIFPCI